MPIFRYFVFVGGALLALLFGVNLVLPQSVADQPSAIASSGEQPLIRIHSDRKLPERVVLDTSQPTIVPPAVKTAAVVVPQQVRAEPSPVLAEMSAKARVRETFAQFVPTAAEAKAPQALPQAKRRVARARSVPPPGRPLMLVAQQPHFGLFNTTW